MKEIITIYGRDTDRRLPEKYKNTKVRFSLAAMFALVVWVLCMIGNGFAEYRAAEARCKSLRGEFGSMKCYKNGREI